MILLLAGIAIGVGVAVSLDLSDRVHRVKVRPLAVAEPRHDPVIHVQPRRRPYDQARDGL